MAVTQVNRLLAASFRGRIRIERLRRLGISGVAGADVTIDDPEGRPVVAVKGARVRAATLAAARSALLGHGPLAVELSEVRVDDIDATLAAAPDGTLSLADAFAPASPRKSAGQGGRGVRLILPRVEVVHLRAHGRLGSGPSLDTEAFDARATLISTPDVLEADIARVRIAVHAIANRADVTGTLRAHVWKPTDPSAGVQASLDWQGAAGAVAHSLRASLSGRRVDAVLDAPRVAAADVRTLWPTSPVDESGSLHAEAHGALPDVAVLLRARLGEAALEADAKLFAGAAEKRADVTLSAHEIDVHELAAGAPHSRLGLRGGVAVAMDKGGALSANATLRFLGGEMSDTTIPSASIVARGSKEAPNRITADAEVTVDEPGAPVRLSVHNVPPGSSVLGFVVAANAPDLTRVPQLRGEARGRVAIDGDGVLDLARKKIDAHLRAAASGITRRDLRVPNASIDASATGPLAGPDIQVVARGAGIEVAGVGLSSVFAKIAGPARAPRVALSTHGPDLPDIDASVELGFAGGVEAREGRLNLMRGGERAAITVSRAALSKGELRIERARLEGLGSPLEADLAVDRHKGDLRVEARTGGLDLARLGRVAHLENRLRAGTLSLDAHLAVGRHGGTGRLSMDLANGAVADFPRVDGHLWAELGGRTGTGKLSVDAGDIGSLDVELRHLEFPPGSPIAAASFRRALGFVGFQGHTDLARLAAVVPPNDSPLIEARGQVNFAGHAGRATLGDGAPDFQFKVTTDHLAMTPKTAATRDIDGVLVMERPRWHFADIDFDVDSHIEAETGVFRVTAKARDPRGPLAQLDASIPRAPYGDLLRGAPHLEVALRRTNFEAHLFVPERGLGTLPPLLRQPYVTGKVQADVHANGTVLTPTVDLRAELRRSRTTENGTPPMDVHITGNYDGRRARLLFKGTGEGRALVDVDASAEAPIAAYLEPGGGAPPWQASATGRFDGFPLESVVFLEDKRVAGRLKGTFSLTGIHRDAKLDASLDVDGLKVGTFEYRSAHLRAKAEGQKLDATARIDQADGFAQGEAHAAASWGSRLAPSLDPNQPLALSLAAKNLSIGVLLPFVDATFDELDGRVDADAKVELDPRVKGIRLGGSLTLKGGTLEAVAGGGRFHDVSASVRFAPDGNVTLEKLVASGTSGRLEGNGSARLEDGKLRSARAVVVIPSSSPIPVSGGGTDFGNIDGRIEIAETTTAGAMAVKVEVPKLRVALNESSVAGAQPLGPIAKVHVGAHRGTPERFVVIPLDPVKKEEPPVPANRAELGIDTHFGDVEVVRGTQLEIDLTGRVNVKPGALPPVQGQIRLKPGGQLEVQGRTFKIDSGTVTFVDDPGNPQATVKASWKAPDGTMVYANFAGPLKSGKVELTSQPVLPKQEIVQLILFGTANGKQAQGANPETSAALGTAGGEATQPLNHALKQLGLGAVRANVDTTSSANPRPEVEIEVARDISLQLAYVLGAPLPGVNPDHTLLTLDWRFASAWSLASTVGDAGTTIFDVLWQRRY
jgi:translocation and assembly module TamB